MTALELLLVASGAVSITLYLRRTLLPWFRGRLDRAAAATSTTLREELLFPSRFQVILALLSLGLLPGAAAAVLARSFPVGLAVALSCPLLSGWILHGYRTRRRRRIALQLPGLLELLAGHLQAGHSLAEGLQEAIPLLPRGIREEVSWIFQMVRVGTPLPDALAHWERRIRCEEIVLVVRPLSTALSTGSDVAGLLLRCRDILEAKQLMEGRRRAMTAQSRLQAVVLTLLPPGFILVLSRIDPDYLPRCLGSVPGIAILSAAALLQAAGWLCIRKIMAETG